MMKLLYAIRFLTIIPIPYKQDEDLVSVARSTICFPLVGLLIGALLYAAALSYQVFNSAVTAAVCLTVWAVITGGLHIDGLCDLADGLGGGKTAERRLEIMKDSRAGAFGVIAVVLLLILKWALLQQLIETGRLVLMIASPVAARWIILNFMLIFPPARKNGMGVFFRQHARPAEPLLAGVYSLLLLWAAGGIYAVGACIAAAALMIPAARLISRALGGLTGDVYGSLTESGEVLFLIIAQILLTALPVIPEYLGGFFYL